MSQPQISTLQIKGALNSLKEAFPVWVIDWGDIILGTELS
jgi:hypothetical protein